MEKISGQYALGERVLLRELTLDDMTCGGRGRNASPNPNRIKLSRMEA